MHDLRTPKTRKYFLAHHMNYLALLLILSMFNSILYLDTNFFNKPPYNTNLLYKEWPISPESPQEASKHEIFKLVDFIEITNGANSDAENLFTKEISYSTQIRGTGGSDSHSKQGLAKSLTVFENQITNKDKLVEQLKIGNFYAAEGLNVGKLKRF